MHVKNGHDLNARNFVKNKTIERGINLSPK